jgi:hypothetical protein
MEGPLLVPGATVRLKGSAAPFVASEHFVFCMDEKKVMISYIEGGFPKWLMPKVEEPVGATMLRYFELQRDAPDDDIFAALGGEQNCESTLTEVFMLMQEQNHGQEGILATNGFGNFFYIRDAAGVLRMVGVHWCDGGWFVEGNRVRGEAWWPVKDRVFVRGA